MTTTRRLEIGMGLLLSAMGLAACGGGQTENCAKFVDCANYYAEQFALEDANTADYEISGSCWLTARAAQDCEEHCVQARADYAAALQLAGKEEGACGN